MHRHVSAAAGWVGTERDGEAAIAQIGLVIAGQRQRSRRLTGRRGMQCQAGETGRALAIHPGKTEILWCDTPDRRSITGMEARDRGGDRNTSAQRA